MGTPGKRGGQQEAQFAAFSLQAAHAAQVSGSDAHCLERDALLELKYPLWRMQTEHRNELQASLRSFLKTMPSEEVEAARQQAAVSAF